ncbi:PepSY-associated TM helix domain-containing protein [Pectobacteriaceae bacterium CE70]|nr:PepSY-associated TM helix domain-containing protein [Pectobacteriaceae bacterium C52]WJV64945.1 PepSY-associated TM helix domain-containing protein [Pectobacteriaceae bacterium CE70]WJY08965.1 PepSY-associated TM helix domain-containing protein [Pectobacteriaceae bacterium C80]
MSNSSTNTRAVRGAFLNLIRRLHFYIGLFVAPFIFVAALTGTLYVLTPQLENYLYKDALTALPVGEAKPLSVQITAARRYAGEMLKVYAVRPAPQATETTRVQFVSGDLGPSESRSIFVDPYSLDIKGDMTVYGTSGVLPLRLWLDRLHRGLLLGDPGRNYSELAASWLWVVALGGVVLWLGTRPRRKAKKVKDHFAVSRYWHITLGLTLLAGLLFFSATGLTWSQWAGGNIDHLRTSLNWLTPQVNTDLGVAKRTAPTDPHAEHHASMSLSGMNMANTSPHQMAINQPDSDWDKVLVAARAAGISAAKVELRQPKGEGKAWTVTEVDRSWPTQVDAVSVNPQTFAIVDHVWFDNFPLVAKLTRWGIDAHMGILFGLPNQLILAFFGFALCGMIVLGYRMWWLRRPSIARVSPLDTLSGAWLMLNGLQKTLVLVITVLLGYALPVMGISLLFFMLIDIWRWQRLNRDIPHHKKHAKFTVEADYVQAKFAGKPEQVRR